MGFLVDNDLYVRRIQFKLLFNFFFKVIIAEWFDIDCVVLQYVWYYLTDRSQLLKIDGELSTSQLFADDTHIHTPFIAEILLSRVLFFKNVFLVISNPGVDESKHAQIESW